MLPALGWVVFGIVLAASVPAQVLGFPGTWLIFADALGVRLLAGGERISTAAVIILGLVAAAAEVLEFYVSVTGAKAGTPVRGTGAAAIAGALAGGIAGAPFFFGLGAVPGMAEGAFLGVFFLSAARGKDSGEALRLGLGAMTGRLKGTAAKVLAAVAMFILLIIFMVGG